MQNSTTLVVKNLWWPFGAHLLHMKWAYINSLMNGYNFFYKYNDSPVFIDGKIDHYYESLNSISENELQNSIQIHHNPDHSNLNLRGHYFPNEYANAHDFHSDILKKIYQPKEYIQKIINSNSLLNNLKCNDIKYIALHIRLGDKVNGHMKETNAIPLCEYFNKCKEVKEKYGLTTIVICSDTSDGLEEILELNSNNEFQLLFNDENRNKNIWSESIVQKVLNGYNDREKLEIEYLNCFINYELLLNSEIIIGNWDSCFCLVPVEMRNNKKDININQSNSPIWGIITQ